MKCLFCDTTLTPAATEGLFVCPHCDAHVYMKERYLIPGKKSPKHLIDSFNYIKFVSESKPDITLSSALVFSEEFDASSTLAIFDSRNRMAMYKQSRYPVTSYTTAIETQLTEVVSFHQIVNYKFSELLTANMASLDESPRVPYITIDMCEPQRYLWQLFAAHNIDFEKRLAEYTPLRWLCATSALECATHISEKSDTTIAVLAGYFKDRRWSQIRKSKDTYWCDAVESYYKMCANNIINSINVEDFTALVDRRMSAVMEKNDAKSMLKDIVQLYHNSDPSTRDIADKNAMFCAEFANALDSTVYDILDNPSSGTVIFTELNRYKLYAWLFDNLGINRPPVAKDVETAYSILKEWCSK